MGHVLCDNCPICKESLNSCCDTCKTRPDIGIGACECELCEENRIKKASEILGSCVTIEGQCGHEYHLHCLEQWLKMREVCPLDNKTWKFRKSLPRSVKSLQNLCCNFLAKRADILLQIIFSDKEILTPGNWQIINAKVTCANIQMPNWLNNEHRQIIAKMFKSYLPSKKIQ